MPFIENYQTEIYNKTFAELSGFTYEKKILISLHVDEDMDDLLFIPNTKIFLFSAPEGYGKHTLAAALGGHLKNDGYKYFFVDCEDVVEEEKEKIVLQGIFSDVFRYTSGSENEAGEVIGNHKFYIVFDNFDVICQNKDACKLLRKSFEAMVSEFSDYDCTCTIVGITANSGDIPAKIRKYMNVLELGLPDEEGRKEFFKKEFTFEIEESKEKFVPYASETPEAALAALTEGLSFGELQRMTLFAKLYYRRKVEENGADFELYMESGIKEKNYFLDEDDVKYIVKSIRKGRPVITNSGQAVSAASQVVYMQAPGMGQIPYGMNPYAASVAEIDDPDVLDLSLFSEIEKEEAENEENDLDEDLKEYDL